MLLLLLLLMLVLVVLLSRGEQLREARMGLESDEEHESHER